MFAYPYIRIDVGFSVVCSVVVGMLEPLDMGRMTTKLPRLFFVSAILQYYIELQTVFVWGVLKDTKVKQREFQFKHFSLSEDSVPCALSCLLVSSHGDNDE